MAAEAGVRQRSLTSRDGTRLNARFWQVEAPRVLLVIAHGLGEHSGRYERLARAMAAHQIMHEGVDAAFGGGVESITATAALKQDRKTWANPYTALTSIHQPSVTSCLRKILTRSISRMLLCLHR